MFWNSQWQSAQLRALCAYRRQKVTLLHLITDLFHKEISSLLRISAKLGTNPALILKSEENSLTKQIGT